MIIAKGTGIYDGVKKSVHHSKIVYQEGVGFEQIQSNSPDRNNDNDTVGTPKFRKNESVLLMPEKVQYIVTLNFSENVPLAVKAISYESVISSMCLE